MQYSAKSIRSFIGAKDYKVSRQFYKTLGFEEIVISEDMCLFRVNDNLAFYLQDYYSKDWVNNTMIFLEVEDLDMCETDLKSRRLVEQFKHVRISNIKTWDWGREIFMHDPSGVLWHFGKFNAPESSDY